MSVQRERGVWWCDLAREIGVPAETLKRWATPRATNSVVLRAVEVICQEAGVLAAQRAAKLAA